MFLDTDVSLTRDWRAKLLAASPYSLAELEQILVEEVYPVCWARLAATGGESAGFEPAWLELQILGPGSASQDYLNLLNLARVAVPRSSEWHATQAAVGSARGV